MTDKQTTIIPMRKTKVKCRVNDFSRKPPPKTKDMRCANKSLTKPRPHSKILAACRGSSVVEQGTHKPLVVGPNPTLGTKIHALPHFGVQNGSSLPTKPALEQAFSFSRPTLA
jgi:hypothetical protein